MRNPHASAGDMGSIPDLGGSHMPDAEQLSLCTTSAEPVPQNLGATTTGVRVP